MFSECLPEPDYGLSPSLDQLLPTENSLTRASSEVISRTGVDNVNCAPTLVDPISRHSSASLSQEPSLESNDSCSFRSILGKCTCLYVGELQNRIDFIVANLNQLIQMQDSLSQSLENSIQSQNEMAKASDQIYMKLETVLSEAAHLKKSRVIRPNSISSSTAALSPCNIASLRNHVPTPETPRMNHAMSTGITGLPVPGSPVKPTLRRSKTPINCFSPNLQGTSGGMGI